MPISYQDQKNFDKNIKIDWWSYGINESDLDLEYNELQKNYKENLIFIQMYFVFPKINKDIRNDIELNKVFKLVQKHSPGNKNPYLLLLGYWITRTNIPEERRKRFNKSLLDMKVWKNYNVQPEDLVRYYNFWDKR